MKDPLNKAINNCKSFDEIIKLCKWITTNNKKETLKK